MGLNILADRHHADLTWSLDLLAKRLGGTLYTPYGMEWYDEGYFKLYGDLRRKDPYRWLAKQYLVDTIFETTKGHGYGRETYNGCKDYPALNLLELEDIKDGFSIDIIICSVHENEPYFAKLKEFYPNAKFIRQVGNDLDRDIDSFYQNLLASATTPYNAFPGHKVLYRQEFPLDIFKPQPMKNFKNIWSFQNDLEQFEDMWEWWTDMKHKLPEFSFKSYGVGNEQGKIYPKREYVEKMLEATFIPQSKGPWEGYGHTIHNAICLGRPMIIKFSDYQGKLAEPLLIKDKTYLEMDDQLVDKIRSLSEDDIVKMSEECVKRFREVVNFDEEYETKLKPFFTNLI